MRIFVFEGCVGSFRVVDKVLLHRRGQAYFSSSVKVISNECAGRNVGS